MPDLDLAIIGAIVILMAERVFGWLKGRGVDLQAMATQCAKIPLIRDDVKMLVEQHKYPDQHGLGTTRTNELLDILIRSNSELTDLLKEFITEIRLERQREERSAPAP